MMRVQKHSTDFSSGCTEYSSAAAHLCMTFAAKIWEQRNMYNKHNSMHKEKADVQSEELSNKTNVC